MSEGHKNVRPFGCTLCGKSYGRRDYLLRHLRSHNEAELAAISAGGSDVEAITSPSSGNTHMVIIDYLIYLVKSMPFILLEID